VPHGRESAQKNHEEPRLLIDTHCHADAYFRLSEVVADVEHSDVRTIAVTNRPGNFFKLKARLADHERIRVATGIHPLEAGNVSPDEIQAFARSLDDTRYVGEVGLDFSQSGRTTRVQQERVFDSVCALLSQRPKVITVHSRGAASVVNARFKEHGVGPVIFHWFSGTAGELDSIIGNGHYLSFNHAMCKSAKGRAFLERVPRNFVLTETDGPFARAHGRESWPSDVRSVCEEIAKVWDCAASDAENHIGANFAQLVRKVDAASQSPA
jgi:TatD DNase family protein